jgi:ankyrin repeat protein
MNSILSWEQACQQGDLAQVTRLVSHQSDCSRSCGLAWAAQYNHLHVVRFLVNKGANNWNWALTHAAFGGHLLLVQLFVDKGANDWNGALLCAAYNGHLSVVEFLAKKGANDWDEALGCAVLCNHLHVTQFLVECGATRWSSACVSLLEQHPDAVIALFQRGKVSREKFTQYTVFEQHIVAFLDWQRQASLQLYNICLLPHELCALVIDY